MESTSTNNTNPPNNPNTMDHHHTSIVLFYKYFIPRNKYPVFHQYSKSYYVTQLADYLTTLCITKYQLKGRILLSHEGINGTLSASSETILQQYINDMKQFNILSDIPPLPSNITDEEITKYNTTTTGEYLFENIDWKVSSNTNTNDTNDDNDTNDPKQRIKIMNPFPDMKISIVNEVISTGGTVEAEEIIEHGGIHLSPTEFHTALTNSSNTNNTNKDIVLIDVRNTFEHDIGYFINPTTIEPALNPETITFSSFDDIFVKKHVNEWKNKDIYMYCTGGIRCEKASVMVKKQLLLVQQQQQQQNSDTDRNSTTTTTTPPPNVYQLQGGIHRYIEQYGSEGYFRGLNFVFDQRVVQKPSSYNNNNNNNNTNRKFQQDWEDNNNNNSSSSTESATSTGGGTDNTTTNSSTSAISTTDLVVGKCIECCEPYDELCGSRICTVCRDLVLVCTTCQTKLYEYHCSKHSNLKTCYYTFLDTFTIDELQNQINELQDLYSTKYAKGHEYRNIRKTITKQINKLQHQIEFVQTNGGDTIPLRNKEKQVRRCRTCMEELLSICNGRCWGFWKSMPPVSQDEIQSIPSIAVGDIVEPGPNWNILKLGSKYCTTASSNDVGNANNNNSNQQDERQEQQQQLLRGRVVEVKAVWSYGGADVAVSWNNEKNDGCPLEVVDDEMKDDVKYGNNATIEKSGPKKTYYPSIYRWGILATNGQRMYDLQHVITTNN